MSIYYYNYSLSSTLFYSFDCGRDNLYFEIQMINKGSVGLDASNFNINFKLHNKMAYVFRIVPHCGPKYSNFAYILLYYWFSIKSHSNWHSVSSRMYINQYSKHELIILVVLVEKYYIEISCSAFNGVNIYFDLSGAIYSILWNELNICAVKGCFSLTGISDLL